MYEIGFVVLHYKTFDDTKNCIDSVLASNPSFPIVVVDNGSMNGTGERLRELYSGNDWVEILLLENNLGFANGNNAGIEHIRRKYAPRFITVMNNDTLLEQNDFKDKVAEEYERSHFSVLGPQIITKDGLNVSNPVEYVVDSKEKAKKLILKREIKLILNRLHLNFLIHDVGQAVKTVGLYDNLKRYEDVKLHGACWIFSEEFFEHFEGLNKSTFLYFEEDILYLSVRDAGLKTVYNPELVIRHLEDASTNSITKNQREKNIFVLENEIKSLNVLVRILE